ncbi:hypothetical protein [Kosmotoga pacifica]|uniref:hypothetical protein n=1 Tax=Kosmotoga pacifica TaxID=1330330 RepID=UPI0023548718|nr:hypothetical protein [Kosmotoga pacifica]
MAFTISKLEAQFSNTSSQSNTKELSAHNRFLYHLSTFQHESMLFILNLPKSISRTAYFENNSLSVGSYGKITIVWNSN